MLRSTALAATITSYSDPVRKVTDVFEEFCRALEADVNDAYRPMANLVDELGAIYHKEDSAEWVNDARHAFREHRISKIILQCPFTKHSVDKPRGYAGDAVLLDYIYKHPSIAESVNNASPLGTVIMRHNLDSPAPVAVRTRANMLAARFGEIARAKKGAHILSVASGHARELERIPSECSQSIERFVAFDQDEQSLDVASCCKNRVGHLDLVKGNIIDLIKNRDIGTFDFIYSAGLYDYLSTKVAKKLTARLFERLNPGGSLLVGNFLTGIRDIGYMEICMDWTLIFRTKAEILGFFGDVPYDEVASQGYYTDPVRNVGYAEVRKRA